MSIAKHQACFTMKLQTWRRPVILLWRL